MYRRCTQCGKVRRKMQRCPRCRSRCWEGLSEGVPLSDGAAEALRAMSEYKPSMPNCANELVALGHIEPAEPALFGDRGYQISPMGAKWRLQQVNSFLQKEKT